MKQTPKSLFPYYEKVDLSDRESWREYLFPNNERIVINEPQYLIVSDNGHRIMDGDGICHYIPYGWIELIWSPKEGYSFYCQAFDSELCEASKIDPPEDEDLGYYIRPVDVNKIEEREKLRDQSDPPDNEDFDKTMGDHINETVSDLVNAFCRFLTNQVDNADRLGSTTEAQTLDRVGKKFTNLFQSWIGKQDEPEEEPE